MFKPKMKNHSKYMVALSIVALTILSIFFSAATSSSTTKEASKVDSLNVTSSFKNGEFIPKKYTCEGEDISPELVITDIPANAKTVAIICDDPDAPVGTFVHWVLWNLPVKGTKAVVAENLKRWTNWPMVHGKDTTILVELDTMVHVLQEDMARTIIISKSMPSTQLWISRGM